MFDIQPALALCRNNSKLSLFRFSDKPTHATIGLPAAHLLHNIQPSSPVHMPPHTRRGQDTLEIQHLLCIGRFRNPEGGNIFSQHQYRTAPHVMRRCMHAAKALRVPSSSRSLSSNCRSDSLCSCMYTGRGPASLCTDIICSLCSGTMSFPTGLLSSTPWTTSRPRSSLSKRCIANCIFLASDSSVSLGCDPATAPAMRERAHACPEYTL